MFDSDLSEMNKGNLAIVGGLGIAAVPFFMFFTMRTEYYSDILVLSLITIIVGFLIMFFYLLDDLKFMFNFAMGRDDPEGFKENLRRGSNAVAGVLIMILASMNIIAFMDYGFDKGLRILVISILTVFSIFLLLYALLVEE